MDIRREKAGDITILVLDGESLDASSTKNFKRDIASTVEANSKVILDLGKVQFVDSSGCGALLSYLKQLHSVGGELKLCAISKSVRSLFELVRMHKIFDIVNTREEALKSYQL